MLDGRFLDEIRAAPSAVRQQFIAQSNWRIRVRRRDGQWVWPTKFYSPARLSALTMLLPTRNVWLIPNSWSGQCIARNV